MAVFWKGRELQRKVARAQRDGVDATLAACVIDAKATHPFRNRTGTAERSIRVVEHAHSIPGGVRGVWGSVNVSYFPFLELGTSRMQAFPTLRPAADREYPKLVERVKRAMRRL